MKRYGALILCVTILLSSCSWPFGGALQTVTFTVLETSGVELDDAIPHAKFVNMGEQAVDILISGEALKNGAFPLMVNKVRADRNEIQIFLDWDKSQEAFSQSIHKLIRLEKGDWWPSGKPPSIRLMNVNGGSLDAVAQPHEVRQAVSERLPALTDDKIYMKFSLENMMSSEPKGVWDVTVIGSPKDGDDKALDIVAKLQVNDQNPEEISGKMTYHSPNNGTIVKVEELD